MTIIDSNREYIESLKKGSHKLVITEQENVQNLIGFFSDIRHPIVGIEWFEDSMRRRICKFPEDYALNQYFLPRKPAEKHLTSMKSKLDYCLKKIEKMATHNLMFDGLVIFIHDSIDSGLADTIKHLIAVNGGYYLDNFCTAATHAITEFLTEETFNELK